MGDDKELDDLDKRISDLKHSVEEKPGEEKPINKAAQMGVELVAGVVIGTGAGMLLDDWLDTKPLFLILCFILGAAAGFVNMIRANK